MKPVLAPSLAELPRDLVWKGDSLLRPATPGHSTGFAQLDAELPGGGWPRGALVELIGDRPGVGEVGLLLPLLRSVAPDRWIAWITPPHLPYAPALAAAGIPLSRLLLITPETASAVVWATRQALASSACHAVLAWIRRTDNSVLRRLQLAAEASETSLFLFRPASAAQQPSPAALRLRLDADGDSGLLAITILKRRGPMAPTPVLVPVRGTVGHGKHHAVDRPPSAPTPVAGLHAWRA